MWQEYFRAHDTFLMPTAFVTAFAHDHSEAPPGPAVVHSDDRVIATAKGLLDWLADRVGATAAGGG